MGQVSARCHDPLPMEIKYDTHSLPEATFLLVIRLSRETHKCLICNRPSKFGFV